MKKLLVSMALGLTAVAGTAAVTPLWLRDVRISPDGREIAFTYKGDIYKVAVTGGEAVRLTSQDAYEQMPVWSPDGKQIAFASDRYGNADVFIMSSEGGSALRLTHNSTSELPWSFSADGTRVVFSASIQDPAASAMFPTGSMTELYTVQSIGGRVEQMLGTPAEMVSFDKAGTRMLYQDRKGFEDEWRKHHTSSITRDVWLYDMESGKHTNLTAHAGEDRNPVFSADGKTVYFLSERDGKSMNVYSFPVDNPGELTCLTRFATHPVRFLSVADNGVLCFTYDGEIYTKKPDGKPEKVQITLVRDDESLPAKLRFTRGATSAAVSADGKQVALTVRGDVFVTSVEYGTTKRVTETVEGESGVDFAPDKRSVVYASERDGVWNIYQSSIKRDDDLNFPNATLIEEERLLEPSGKTDRERPRYSPDGKEVAFIENETKLMVLNLETKKVRQVTDGSQWFSGGFNYAWSPDGKWFALEIIGNGHDPYSDIAIVKSDGSEKPVNLTNSGYFNTSPRWVLDGNAVLFMSDRYGMRSHASWGSLNDVMLVFMNKDAYNKFRLSEEDYALLKELEKEQEKAAKEKDEKAGKEKEKKEEKEEDEIEAIKVELDGITDRIVRVTPNSSDLSDAVITKDGETLFYLSAFESGFDLWKIKLREHEASLVKKLDSSWAGLELDADGSNLFILGSGSMQKMSVAGESLKPITFTASMTMNLDDEREYMFEHVCRQEERHFYRTDMHGVDWPMMTAAYRKFLPHINNNYDFAELLSEMLGELNVSHTGGRFGGNGGGDVTADLGLLYDLAYEGAGMKVSEVLEKGPFDRETSRVKPGTIVEKINGKDITATTDFYALMNNLAGKKTLVSLYDPSTGERWDEVVKPYTRGAVSLTLYKRWVKQRAADVEKWSNGRLGYVHIESMDDGSFRTVYSDLLGKYNKCEGVVVDTRFNGGGRLHEDIEVLLSGKKYLTQVYRGRAACDMPSRRWNKPSIMVQCEANYSNAHGTPWVYKHQGIGKLVGAPVPGTMTSVSWEVLQNGTVIFGTPVVGYQTADGSYLENKQLEPDIYVLNAPETIVKGEDTQLKAAVDELLKEIDAAK